MICEILNVGSFSCNVSPSYLCCRNLGLLVSGFDEEECLDTNRKNFQCSIEHETMKSWDIVCSEVQLLKVGVPSQNSPESKKKQLQLKTSGGSCTCEI